MPAPNTRILIVDDEAPMLALLAERFGNAGYDVMTATDGEEGWRAACEHCPDLVLADYCMPVLDGLEMCRRLLADDRTRRLPVLMISSKWRVVEERAREFGNVVGVFHKPFRFAALKERVRALLAEATLPAPQPAP